MFQNFYCRTITYPRRCWVGINMPLIKIHFNSQKSAKRTSLFSKSTKNEVSSILKDWWSNLGFTWTFFLEKLQEPFEDVQIAIHQVLTNVLPHHSWALEPFSEAPGFMEYILGRRTGVNSSFTNH